MIKEGDGGAGETRRGKGMSENKVKEGKEVKTVNSWSKKAK